MNEEEILEVCADPDVTVFEDIEEKAAEAKVSELLAMRKKALAEAKETERVLRQGEIDGAIPWCEDASIIYDYQNWVAD